MKTIKDKDFRNKKRDKMDEIEIGDYVSTYLKSGETVEGFVQWINEKDQTVLILVLGHHVNEHMKLHRNLDEVTVVRKG